MILNEANKRSFGYGNVSNIMIFLALLLTFAPFMVRGFYHSGGTVENRRWAYLHDTLLILTTPALLYINLMLLYVPIFDTTRRKKIAQLLNYFTAVITIRAEQSFSLPVIDMFKAQNVYSWAYARLVLQSLGQRILQRIDGYVGIWIFVALVMVIEILILALDPMVQCKYWLSAEHW